MGLRIVSIVNVSCVTALHRPIGIQQRGKYPKDYWPQSEWIRNVKPCHEFFLSLICQHVYMLSRIRDQFNDREAGVNALSFVYHMLNSSRGTDYIAIFSGSESHLSCCCFRLFAAKFWEVVWTYKCYFDILWLQVEWRQYLESSQRWWGCKNISLSSLWPLLPQPPNIHSLFINVPTSMVQTPRDWELKQNAIWEILFNAIFLNF